MNNLTLNEEEINQALLIKLAESIGFTCQMTRDANKIHLTFVKERIIGGAPTHKVEFDVDSNTLSSEEELTLFEAIKNSKPAGNITVPRNSDIGNSIVAKRCVSKTANPMRYCRTKTSSNQLRQIDKRYTYQQVEDIVSLRLKKHDEQSEYVDARKVEAQKFGCYNVIQEKISWKEAIVLIDIAENMIGQDVTINKLTKFLYDEYHLGFDKYPSLYQMIVFAKRSVVNTELASRFRNGEEVDMNYSERFFKEIQEKQQEQQEQQ